MPVSVTQPPTIPSGGIILWSGSISSIPSGWALCNGSDGTPDLRDRFIVGAKQYGGGVAKSNWTGSLTQSGGSATHNHFVTASLDAGTQIINSSPAGNFSATFAAGSVYNNTTYNPPYYALAYIMKL